ncbi:efflux RND transporter periplasmic adaptor subunit [Candidatus Dependentiae bacterium]|nr:efflux RND transporter periplasmic adaptor subunit [Candidatus Dependentiae bacterium]
MEKIIFWGIIFLLGITGCSKNEKFSSEKINDSDKKNISSQKPDEMGKTIPVRTAVIEKEKISEAIELQGNASAKEYAVVPARLDGIIEKLYVDEGMKVVKGETRLFKIEAENLENNLKIQQHSLGVAESALEESKANFERVKADNHKTAIDYERAKRLIEKNVITQDIFEQQESRYKQSNAMLKHAEALIKLSEESVKQAAASLEIARKKLKDSEVTAPASGYISKRFIEEGEMAKFGAPVFRIDNTDIIELSAYLPAEYYAKIISNKTRMDAEVNGIKLKNQVVSYKSPVLNENFRTFEIKSLIKNIGNSIFPGSMAIIKVYVDEEKEAFTIPKSAIIKKNNKNYVYAIKDNCSVLIEINTGSESNGKIEIYGAEIRNGMKIIIEGQSFVKNGSQVNSL